MKEQPQNQALGASETAHLFFCTRISSAAGAAGELCTGKRKEPDMAKRNTNPGIGESADFGVMHNPQPSCARTHARVVRPTGILKESLTDLPGARARVREESADFIAWRVKTFGGDFDPVCEAVEDVVAEFSDRQPARDRSLWLRLPTRSAMKRSGICTWNSYQSCASTSCAIPPRHSRTVSTATPITPLSVQSRVRGAAPSVPRRKAVWHEPSQNNGLCCRCHRFSRAYSCRPSRY